MSPDPEKFAPYLLLEIGEVIRADDEVIGGEEKDEWLRVPPHLVGKEVWSDWRYAANLKFRRARSFQDMMGEQDAIPEVPEAYADMVRTLAKSGGDILTTLTPADTHILHMAVGLSGEAAELLQAFAVSTWSGMDLDRDNCVEELGDLEFFLQGLRDGAGLERQEPNLDGIDWSAGESALHAVAALVVKTGDLLDLIKKKVIYRKPVEPQLIAMCLQPVEYCLQRIRQHIGVEWVEILAGNQRKLAKRYAEGYSDTAAQVRADKS